jgi:hypothetical protein
MKDELDKYRITYDEIEALRSLAQKLAALATDRGWYDKPREDGTMIALMHSELSEALEGVRKNKQDDHLPMRKAEEVEFADAIIRILDWGEQKGLDIPGAIAEKHLYNATRADHSREARAKDDGKAF